MKIGLVYRQNTDEKTTRKLMLTILKPSNKLEIS